MGASQQEPEWGEIGLDPAVEDFIRTEIPSYPDSSLRQLLADPQVALLYLLAREALGASEDISETTDRYGDYFAREYTVTTNGVRVTDSDGNLEIPDEADPDNATKVDMESVYRNFTLRFTDDIAIAFKPPNKPFRTIHYRADDSPVVGKKVTTRFIWLARHAEATSNPTVWIEADNNT